MIKKAFKDTSSAKSYKTLANAQKALSEVEKDLEDVECFIQYEFVLNEKGRINIMFIMSSGDNQGLSFHYFVNKGHLVRLVA